ncbi:alpha-tectorin-like [Aquarana catesbeiana]|uniref:alpha-tectorin-like n=1 Tax=Aquarana catesbeiana TaxID=8400 RepID=UPI003CC9B207
MAPSCVNTFQAVLSTDGNQTFLLYNYGDIQWPSMNWTAFSQDGPLALAGLNSGYETGYYTLPGSLTISVANLSSTSNVNVTGRWAFKVDKLHPEDVNGNIDNSTENVNSTGTPLTTMPGPFTTRSTTITSPFTRNTTNTSSFIQSSGNKDLQAIIQSSIN